MGRIAWSLDAFIFPDTHCGSTYASMDALGRISKKNPCLYIYKLSTYHLLTRILHNITIYSIVTFHDILRINFH